MITANLFPHLLLIFSTICRSISSSPTTGLLGEMQLQQGKVRVCGKIAYCDQRPWIMNTTVRDNILFGLEYDEAKFDMALHASSLEDDIKVINHSDSSSKTKTMSGFLLI